jgi:ABC-type branched-subunit amino acid transport system substrate-binding protein
MRVVESVRASRVRHVVANVPVAVAVVAAVLVGTVSGSAAVAGAQSASVPGVTAKQIRVGAIIGKTNPTGVQYEQVVTGAKAFFDGLNRKGGVFGRQVKIVDVVDDQTRSSKDLLGARQLVEEDKVFAALVATQEFSGADVFVKSGTPVFGYNIQVDWSKGPNLFGTYGSYLCLDTCPQIGPAYVAQQVGAKHPAIFGYGSSPQSADCANVTKLGFEKWGPKPAVFDTSLSFGFSANDIAGAVQAMKDNQVDFVTTCMDLQGEVNLKKALEAAGVQGTKFYAPQGYDAKNLAQLGDTLDGFTFLTQFVPFEAAQGNPGMTQFVAAMKKIHEVPSENLFVGWVAGELMVRGIQDAGKDFTQQSVVAAINRITDWNANGKTRPTNWTTAHGPAAPGDSSCTAFVTVEKAKFVPVFGQPGKPFVCFPVNPYAATLDVHTFVGK